MVFRRGPSKQVLLLRWWLEDDRVEPGQWFKGRIYERRCDLSPDGDLLIYFAANWHPPYESWTAVSRTPYLTALALWPKGDAWGGGGLFEGPKTIGINHLAVETPVILGAEKAKWHPLGPEQSALLPANYTVQRWGEYAGRGEDNPVCHHRMVREGWTRIADGEAGRCRGSGYSWLFESPEIYECKSPRGEFLLRRYLRAIGETNGSWYVEDFEVAREDGSRVRMIENCSWADWQANGDLLFALDGSLHRLTVEDEFQSTTDPLKDTKLVADLSSLRFEEIAAPEWARQWP